MKRLSELLKKTPTSTINSDDKSSNSKKGQSQTRFDVGPGLSGFMPNSKTSIVLLGVLTLALGVFAYRYLTQLSDPQATLASAAPISISPKIPLLEESPDKVETARKLFGDQKFEESIAMYGNMLKKTPNDVQILNDLGVLYLKRKMLSESETYLKKSIELAPDCVTCLNNLGYLKTLMGQSADAETYLKRAIALDDAFVDAYFNLGVLYEKNGDMGGSANAYREFLRRSTDKESAFNLQLKQHLFSILEK